MSLHSKQKVQKVHVRGWERVEDWKMRRSRMAAASDGQATKQGQGKMSTVCGGQGLRVHRENGPLVETVEGWRVMGKHKGTAED